MQTVKLFKYIGEKQVSAYCNYIDMEGGKRDIITTDEGCFAIDDKDLSSILKYTFRPDEPHNLIGKIDPLTKHKTVKKYNRNFSRDDVKGIPWYGFIKRLENKNYTTREVSYITGISKNRLTDYARKYKVPKWDLCYVWSKSHVIDVCQRRYSKTKIIKYEDDFYGI